MDKKMIGLCAIGFLLFVLLVFNPFENFKTSDTNETAKPSSDNIPVGTYLLSYMGDEEGNRVDEFNEVEVSGKKTDIIQFLYEYASTESFTINEDGTGLYKGGDAGAVERKVTFYNDYFETEGGTKVSYKYDGEKFWSDYKVTERGSDIEGITMDDIYAEDNGVLKYAPWERGESFASSSIFEKTTPETVALVFEGKGGSVPIKDAEIGDKVCIGNFDTLPGNEKIEPIFWRVIDKKDGKLLILSDQLLDNYAFNNNQAEEKTTSWETSSLRAFLNGDFYTMCFTEDEQKLIQETHLTNEACNEFLHEYWGNLHNVTINGWEYKYSLINNQNQKDGNETDDKIFVLSVNELTKYFPLGTEKPTEEDGEDYPFTEFVVTPEMIATITKAVEDNGDGFYDRDTLGGAYLTRTLSSPDNEVVYVSGGGQFFQYFNYGALFIRPAMWISAE